MSATSGSCFGYDVRSSVPLRFLRAPGGEPLEVIRHAIACPTPDAIMWGDWPADDAQPVHVTVYRTPGGYQMWVEGDGWFVIDPAHRRIGIPEMGDPIRLEERLWGMPAMLCFLHRGDLPLHAAAIDTGDGALIIGAPSGFGKTTLAAGFWRSGYRVLTEDLACVRPGASPSVVPGPAMLRLRDDMATRLGAETTEGAIRGGGRVRIPLAGPGDDCSQPVALRGFVMLVGEGESITLRRASVIDAIRLIWELVFTLPAPFDEARCFAEVADLAAAVPAWELSRPLTVESLPDVVAHIVANA